jgi:hypothetical protein
MSNLTLHPKWPEHPYRGLNYFRPQDRLLLAGRDNDVATCFSLLAHPRTRVLLLHGSTGCGKSSFLRAGLIPTMEQEGAGYLFLKIPGADDEALFIRCTEAPVDQIARQVFVFASEPFRLKTPKRWQELDVRPALLGADKWETYLARVRDEDGLLESLRRIAGIIPQTLVLIVDQAEEVLTLNPGEGNFVNRARFFQLLRGFQTLEFDSRIIVALRTEFFGRFIDATQVTYRAAAEFQQFFLSELSRSALIDAILRPTKRQELHSFGAPYAMYGFSFEDGLPELIVDDVMQARHSGPALPILQLACLGLYDDCKRLGQTLIKKSDYAAKGGVEGQIIFHVASAIRSVYPSEEEFKADIEDARTFLGCFYTMQDDGSVVARTLDAAWVTAELRRLDLGVVPDDLLRKLTSPQTMILRELRNVRADGRLVDQITLGHDSIALALERWARLDAEDRFIELLEKDSKKQCYRSLFAAVGTVCAYVILLFIYRDPIEGIGKVFLRLANQMLKLFGSSLTFPSTPELKNTIGFWILTLIAALLLCRCAENFFGGRRDARMARERRAAQREQTPWSEQGL